MANVIKLKKGLDINLKGKAAAKGFSSQCIESLWTCA